MRSTRFGGGGTAAAAAAAAVAAADNNDDSGGGGRPFRDQEAAKETFHFRAVRLLVLVILCAQNCALMIITSYSRSLPGPQYLASSAVAAGEGIKLFFILLILSHSHGICNLCSVIRSDIFGKGNQTAKLAIPAFFYTIQNNLWYYGMSNLDSVTAAVTSQLKVPSTAIFAVIILGTKLTPIRWLAIAMLVAGLTVMQLKPDDANSGSGSAGTQDIAMQHYHNYYPGMVAMLLSCTSSGFAGVYSEYLIKNMEVGILMFNLQMQIFSVPVGLLTVWADLSAGHAGSIFEGWNRLTCLVVLLNALGGIMVTMTMKYADNILKTFAVSMSLVINCLLSFLFMSTSLDAQDICGVVVVIGGTWMYNCGTKTPPSAVTTSSSDQGLRGLELHRGVYAPAQQDPPAESAMEMGDGPPRLSPRTDPLRYPPRSTSPSQGGISADTYGTRFVELHRLSSPLHAEPVGES